MTIPRIFVIEPRQQMISAVAVPKEKVSPENHSKEI
jgi:hypothetical protein